MRAPEEVRAEYVLNDKIVIERVDEGLERVARGFVTSSSGSDATRSRKTSFVQALYRASVRTAASNFSASRCLSTCQDRDCDGGCRRGQYEPHTRRRLANLYDPFDALSRKGGLLGALGNALGGKAALQKERPGLGVRWTCQASCSHPPHGFFLCRSCPRSAL